MSKEKKWDKLPRIVYGRYGLSSKEFTPAMVKSNLRAIKIGKSETRIPIGILDDLTNTSIDYDKNFTIERKTQFVLYFTG